jgi:hypothetical protein
MASEPGRGISLERWLRSTSLDVRSGEFELLYKPEISASKTYKLHIYTGQFQPPNKTDVQACGVCTIKVAETSMYTVLVGVLPDEDGLFVVHDGTIPYAANQERIRDDTPDAVRSSELVKALTHAAELKQKILAATKASAISMGAKTEFVSTLGAYLARVC